MYPSIHIINRVIPTYGLMVVLGIAVANLIALRVMKRRKMEPLDFVIIEAYVLLGAGIGAKLLYFVVSLQDIAWERFFELEYFSQIMRGGFVFYGGLIGGLIFWVLAGKIHQLAYRDYAEQLLFLIPFIHGFGRIGCFFAGCCYGIPYDGIGAVHFPEGSIAPAGEALLPIQLIEAAGLFAIAGFMYLRKRANERFPVISFYLLAYAVLRFILEFFRYDSARGSLGHLSTSQWISLVLVAAVLAAEVCKRVRKRSNKA